MRGCRQQVDIVALTLRLVGKFIDQCRHQSDHISDHLLHFSTRGDGAVEHTVEQILNRPAQLTDHQGTHHTATALEGVEGAANFAQGILVVSIGAPLREVLANGFQHLTDFFDKDFQQFVIDRLFIGRWWQQAGRHVMSGRIDRLHWRGHDIGHRQGFLDNRLLRLIVQRGAGQFDLRQLKGSQFGFAPVAQAVRSAQLQAIERQFISGLLLSAFQQWQWLGVDQINAEVDQLKIGLGAGSRPLGFAARRLNSG